jgi:succinate-semialdehyde dehydrogenase
MVSPTAENAVGGGLTRSSSTRPSDVQQLVARARVAQATFEAFSQEQVDAIVRDFGKYVYDNAETIAAAAHKETGLGVYEDEVLKAKSKARVIWNNLKGKKSRGIIGGDENANLVLVAKPMGVVAAVCPVTNPIVTPMCNAMFALKAGNAVIFAPHPKAEAATRDLTGAYRRILKKHGAPEDLIQMVLNSSVETTQALMRASDVVVATGGGAMVKAAYSSGKPSYGLGAGNVSVIIDRGVTSPMRSTRLSPERPSTTASSARTSSSCWPRRNFTTIRSRSSSPPARSGSRLIRTRCRSSVMSCFPPAI